MKDERSVLRIPTSDANALSEEQVDTFLDLCQVTLLPRSNEGACFWYILVASQLIVSVAEANVVTNYFGLSVGRPPERTTLQPSSINRSLDANVMIDGTEHLRPGQAYPVYSSRDVLGTLPEGFEELLKHGASWIMVDEGFVCRVLEMFERRLLRWWTLKKRHRREQAKKPGDLEVPEVGRTGSIIIGDDSDIVSV